MFKMFKNFGIILIGLFEMFREISALLHNSVAQVLQTIVVAYLQDLSNIGLPDVLIYIIIIYMY